MKTVVSLLFLAALALLAGCPGAVRQVPTTLPPGSAVIEPDLASTVYAVSAADSEVHILVFRGGVLAALGHNHVITSRALAGRVWLHPALAGSGFELSFPVDALIVDDAQARAAAGGDFATPLSQSDRDGTRKNMLGPEVLDAQRHPTVRLRSLAVVRSKDALIANTRITIKEVSRSVEVPTAMMLEGSRLTATGEFEILQSDFGMRPFSAALGALTVQDRLVVRFKVVALDPGAAPDLP